MFRRYGRYIAGLGGLAAIFLLETALIAAPSNPQNTPHAAPASASLEPINRERLSAYERESLVEDRAANRISESANAIARDQRLFALWQLFLGGAGVIFTGIAAFFAYRATHWAKEAAGHTKRSADADNEALKETRKAASAARKDAAAQAVRFAAQMDKTQEMVEFTAKSAYAMESSANASRGIARATRESAAKQLRPYLYMTHEKFAPRRLADGQEGKEVVEVVFSLQNFGQTPAKRVRLKAETMMGSYWSEEFEPDFSRAVWVPWADIPPGVERPWIDESAYRLLDLTKDNLLRLRTETGSIFFHGVIEYEDGDGGKYTTYFRRAATGPNFWLRPIVTEGGNDAT